MLRRELPDELGVKCASFVNMLSLALVLACAASDIGIAAVHHACSSSMFITHVRSSSMFFTHFLHASSLRMFCSHACSSRMFTCIFTRMFTRIFTRMFTRTFTHVHHARSHALSHACSSRTFITHVQVCGSAGAARTCHKAQIADKRNRLCR
jgi:hypothetical protein